MTSKSLALGLLVVAVVAPICINWIQAQKTAANSFQQKTLPNYGQSTAVQRRQQSSLVAPAQRRTYQSGQSSWQQVQPVQQSQQSSYQSQQSSYQQQSSNYDEQQAEANAEPAQYGAVSGQPGRDFPAYTQVPKTSFSCEGLPYDYGMYADEETGCQAFHVCYNGRKESFLCGVGTVFNQRILHCDYWYSVDCGKSSQYYGSNAYMGSSQPEPGPAQAQSSYQRTGSASANRPAQVAAPSYQRSQSSYNTQQVQEAY